MVAEGMGDRVHPNPWRNKNVVLSNNEDKKKYLHEGAEDELCRKPRRLAHSESSFAERSPRSALELQRRKDQIRRAPLRPPVTRKTKEQQSSTSSPTKLPTSSEIVPHKKTHTHNIIHSFIHSLQACSHWPSASECSVSAPPSFSSPRRPSGSKKSGRAPNSHHISFRPHHDTKQNLSLSLSLSFTAKSRSNQLPFALKLANTRNTKNLVNSSTAKST